MTREEKRARIVGGALELIVRFGLRKTTVEDIANQVGLKPASVYYYFESKEEIFAAAIRQAAEQVISQIQSAMDDAETAEAKLMAFFHARYSYVQLLEGVTRAVAVELYPLAEEAITEFEDQGGELLVSILELGIETGEFQADDPAALARGIMTGMRGMDSMFVMHRADEKDMDMEGLVALLRTFLSGLKVDRRGVEVRRREPGR